MVTKCKYSVLCHVLIYVCINIVLRCLIVKRHLEKTLMLRNLSMPSKLFHIKSIRICQLFLSGVKRG